MFEHDKFFYFIQIVPSSGTFSFRNYTDNDGNTYSAFSTLGQTFNDHKPFWVTFSARERTYRAPKEREVLVSKNGDTPKKMKLKDYLLNTPFTAESPNLRGEPKIKLFDEIRDAKTGVDRRTRRIEAGNIALNLNPEQLAQMAQLIGVFSDDPMVQKNRVLEFADQDPEYFLELHGSGDRATRSLIKKGLSAGVLKKKGKMIMWDKEMVGPDEDEAVANLQKTPALAEAIKKAVDKLK
jgi:hypothetical protein